MQQIELPQSYQNKGIFDQYIYFLKHFEAKYGPKTTLLMQVGSFYELYGVDNEEMKINQVKEITSILNIELTRRDKSVQENNMKNHLMAGFPCPALPKFLDILVENNYTVVVVDQNGTGKDKVKPNLKLDRYISYIVSPGTYISERNNDTFDDRFLVQIHIEGYQRMNQLNANQQIHSRSAYQPMLIGISAIDVTTGQSDVYEVSNTSDDQDFAINEIYRYLQTHSPKELIISTNGLKMSEEKLIEYLGLDYHNIRYQLDYNNIEKRLPDSYKLAYQKELFEKIWSTERRNSMLSVIEYLNLERTPSALMSYLQLIQYTYEHNEILLNNLKRPRIWDQSSLLLLANTAITQLDLVNSSNRRMGSICNMLNMTSTSMGRRLFRDRLLNPLRNGNEIEERYRKIDIMMTNNLWETIEKQLNGMIDLDKMHRRIELGLISPNALFVLNSCYKQIGELLTMIPESLAPAIKSIQSKFSQYLKFLSDSLDFNELSKYVQLEKINDNLFKHGYNKELDEITQEIRLNNAYLDSIMDHMTQLILGGPGSQLVTLKSTEASGYYLNMTTIRYKTMLLKIKDYENKSDGKNKDSKNKPDIPHVSTYTFKVRNRTFTFGADTFRVLRSNKDESNINISSDDLDAISDTLSNAIKKLKRKIIEEVWQEFIDKLYHNHSELYQNLSNLIAELDVIKASAKAAIQYRYCRPKIIPAQDKTTASFLQARNFRHPLIEQLNQNSYYVPHNLQLGRSDQYNDDSIPNIPKMDSMPTMEGMLIYGCNSSGKSSIMKAIGVCVTMAQAGFFVPADSFSYTPYHRILTRILGNDNIFRGDSSFAVEMKELRDILVRADSNSLVLGDEVCRGTETDSGVAIVAATITRLTRLKSHYIFATHLHQLATDDEILGLTVANQPHKLGIYHLHVDYDPSTHKLVYDRQMKPGSGNSIYGIEVARAMDLDEDFIHEAHRFRQKLQSSQPSPTTSSQPSPTTSSQPSSSTPSQPSTSTLISQSTPADHPISPKSKPMVTAKSSNYNKSVIMNECKVCKIRPEATHHIKFQSEADEQGYIGTMHKNSAKNLVPLCKQCHHQIDTGELEIRGWIETSQGRVLDYTKHTIPLQTKSTTKKTLSLIKK